ncbi:MAG: hypothetical protein ACKVTZ_15975 [Bacteroidia bacterium]
MEDIFKQLQQIQQVEVDDANYARVLQKIRARQQAVISIVWVRAAAAMLLLLLSAETYFLVRQNTPQTSVHLQQLVSVQDNHLYDE